MRKQFLKTLFCWLLVLSGCATAPNKESLPLDSASEHPSVELQLLGVHLGMPYTEAKAELTQKYGPPFKSESTPRVADTFKLDPNTNNVIKIYEDAERGYPSTVMTILADGTTPIPGLNFFSNANLGDLEKDIPLKFPRAKLVVRGGIHEYDIPHANYFMDVKNGKVISLGIIDNFTTQVKGGGDSISLTGNLATIANQEGLLTNEDKLLNPTDMAKLKALAHDPLRPYCKERYPMRQRPLSGKSYVDVNVFKNEKEPPVPVTFLVDTGTIITAISPELCKKVTCKYRKPLPSKRKKAQAKDPNIQTVSAGVLQFGNLRDEQGVFYLIPPELLRQPREDDGILGGSTLLLQPLLINFKQGYLCFPALPIPQVAQKLKFATITSEIPTGGFLNDFYLNGQKLMGGCFDSGAYLTFLYEKDIARLKLRNLGKIASFYSESGPFSSPLYGPVEIGWPRLGITKKLQTIAKSDDKWSYLGIDFLRHYILSVPFFAFDGVYIGE